MLSLQATRSWRTKIQDCSEHFFGKRRLARQSQSLADGGSSQKTPDSRSSRSNSRSRSESSDSKRRKHHAGRSEKKLKVIQPVNHRLKNSVIYRIPKLSNTSTQYSQSGLKHVAEIANWMTAQIKPHTPNPFDPLPIIEVEVRSNGAYRCGRTVCELTQDRVWHRRYSQVSIAVFRTRHPQKLGIGMVQIVPPASTPTGRGLIYQWYKVGRRYTYCAALPYYYQYPKVSSNLNFRCVNLSNRPLIVWPHWKFKIQQIKFIK